MLGRSKSIKASSNSTLPARSREEESSPKPAVAHQPTGLVNDGNTCYLNSVFQSLIHTPPLAGYLLPLDCSDPPWQPATTYTLDRSRCPAFMADRNEHRDLMPLAAAFIESAGRSWRTEIAGFDSSTAGAKGQGLKTLLYTISRKYDQYADYEQQDSHELLRHLLDSMRMEEVDVIKRLHPPAPAPKEKERGRKRASSAAAKASATPAEVAAPPPAALETVATEVGSSADVQATADGSPATVDLSQSPEVQTTTAPALDPKNGSPLPPSKVTFIEPSPEAAPGPGLTDAAATDAPAASPEPHNMMSFVDLLFGGRLASMIICESCKSVSHTYEDFLDLSMGLPNEESQKQRNPLKSMAKKLRGKLGMVDSDDGGRSDSALASDEDDDEIDANKPLSRRGSTTDFQPSARRESFNTVSSAGAKDLGRKRSFLSFGVKRSSSRRASSALSDTNESTPSGSRPGSPIAEDSHRGPPGPGGSPLATTSSFHKVQPSSPRSAASVIDNNPKFPKLKPSQAAYISQILGGASHPSQPSPLSLLRSSGLSSPAEAAVGGWLGLGAGQSGLMDALRQFTAVEVLEGDNAFACKKCWRWEHPRADGRPWRRGGETGNDADDEDDDDEPAQQQQTEGPPSTSDSKLESIRDVEVEELAPVKSRESVAEGLQFDSGVEGGGSSTSAQSSVVASSDAATVLSRMNLNGSVDDDDSIPQATSYAGLAIPTISTFPSSPAEEFPPSSAPSSQNPSTDSSAAPSPTPGPAPAKSSTLRPTNLRPAATRGHSYTRHVNPSFEQVFSDSDMSDVTADPSTDDESVSHRTASPSPSTSSVGTNGPAPATTAVAPAPPRPKAPTRKKSVHLVMRRAFKRYLIVNPPPVLVFHLKRFEQISKNGVFSAFGSFTTNFKKIDAYISFPEVIDIAPFLAPARIGAPVTTLNATAKAKTRLGKAVVDAVKYQLCAIVVHIGSMGGGHYISYVFASPSAPPSKHADGASPVPPSPSPSSASVSSLDPNALSTSASTESSSASASASGLPPTSSSASASREDLHIDGIPHPSSAPDLRVPPFTSSSASSTTSSSHHHHHHHHHSHKEKDPRVWYRCSDTEVRRVDKDEVLKSKAYLLFYEAI